MNENGSGSNTIIFIFFLFILPSSSFFYLYYYPFSSLYYYPFSSNWILFNKFHFFPMWWANANDSVPKWAPTCTILNYAPVYNYSSMFRIKKSITGRLCYRSFFNCCDIPWSFLSINILNPKFVWMISVRLSILMGKHYSAFVSPRHANVRMTRNAKKKKLDCPLSVFMFWIIISHGIIKKYIIQSCNAHQ